MRRLHRGCVVSLALLAGCRTGGTEGARAAGPPAQTPEQDAQVLGRRIFELIDRAADYRASHRGRYPLTVAQMGIDSLTPATAARLSARDTNLTVTVEFRHPESHALASCTAGTDVLEFAALNEGKFSTICTTPDGHVQPLQVDGQNR